MEGGDGKTKRGLGGELKGGRGEMLEGLGKKGWCVWRGKRGNRGGMRYGEDIEGGGKKPQFS